MKWIIALFILLSSQWVFAFCFEEAGKYFDINPNLLMAISFTESRFDSKAINYNKNKMNKITSIDYGLMQINSWWFDYFKKKGIKQSEIKEDPCINVFIGAYILNHNFNISGKNWNSVGAYNTGFRKGKRINKIRNKYIALVKENFIAFENE